MVALDLYTVQKEDTMGRIGTYESISEKVSLRPFLRKKDRVGVIIACGEGNHSIIATLLQEAKSAVCMRFGEDGFSIVMYRPGFEYQNVFYLLTLNDDNEVAILLNTGSNQAAGLRNDLGLLLGLMGDEQRLVVMHSAASIDTSFETGQVRLVERLMGDGIGAEYLMHDDPPVWLDQALPCEWSSVHFRRLQKIVLGNGLINGKRAADHICFRGPLWPSKMLWRFYTRRHPVSAHAQTIGLSSLSKIADLVAIENHGRERDVRIAFAPCIFIDRKMFHTDMDGFVRVMSLHGNELKKVVGTIRRLVKLDWVPEHLR